MQQSLSTSTKCHLFPFQLLTMEVYHYSSSLPPLQQHAEESPTKFIFSNHNLVLVATAFPELIASVGVQLWKLTTFMNGCWFHKPVKTMLDTTCEVTNIVRIIEPWLMQLTIMLRASTKDGRTIWIFDIYETILSNLPYQNILIKDCKNFSIQHLKNQLHSI